MDTKGWYRKKEGAGSPGLGKTCLQAFQLNILVATDYYLPGYKAGGPQRSINNIAARLGDVFTFTIVTSDRDFGDNAPYPDIQPGKSKKIGNANVYYFPVHGWSLRLWRRILNEIKHDVLYLNSFFSPRFTVIPLLLRYFRLAPRVPVILAPRGEFSRGALAINKKKKWLFQNVAFAMGLYNGILWHCSSEYEKTDILRSLAKNLVKDSVFHIAGNLPNMSNQGGILSSKEKQPGSVRMVFLSRVSRKKNLDGALKLLSGLNGEVFFDIYGPAEDSDYWGKCENIIAGLPKNVSVSYKGPVTYDKVLSVLSSYHFFFFPTHGENYGHVIFEAMSAGLPLIISDQTPWRGLADYGVGWDIPLEGVDEFRRILQMCVDMGGEDYANLSNNASRFALSVQQGKVALEQNLELFRMACAMTAK